MPIVDTIGRIDEITSLVTTLEGRGNAASAARFETTLAAQPAAVAPVPATTGTATAGGVTGQAIVDQAKQYLGVPYVLGGTDRSGIDCSGLVQRVLGELGIEVPRRVSQQESVGEEVGSLADAQPGDLIVTHNADHIVIYAGDGMIVHAPYEGRTVSYQPNYLTDADIQTIRRVVPSGSAVPPA
ncbi:MAG: C40 family peptidase, partial [Agromyces sp.]